MSNRIMVFALFVFTALPVFATGDHAPVAPTAAAGASAEAQSSSLSRASADGGAASAVVTIAGASPAASQSMSNGYSSSTRALGLEWGTNNTPNGAPAAAPAFPCVSRAVLEQIAALKQTSGEGDKWLLEELEKRTYAYPLAMGHSGSSAAHFASLAFGRGTTAPEIVKGDPVPLSLCPEVSAVPAPLAPVALPAPATQPPAVVPVAAKKRSAPACGHRMRKT